MIVCMYTIQFIVLGVIYLLYVIYCGYMLHVHITLYI